MMAKTIAKPALREGILYVNLEGANYAFVQKDHAVISFLANRADLIGCNIREQPLCDGYYKIGRGLLHFVCNQLAKFDVTRLQMWIRETWLTRIQQVRERKRMAVAMCLHSRLGQASGLAVLDTDLVALVVDKLKDVGDDRIKRGRLVPRAKPKQEPMKPRYMTGAALVWTDLSKVDVNKLNRRFT